MQGPGTPTDPQRTWMQAVVGTSPLGGQGGDALGLLPMLGGTERAQAQVPAACLWVGDPQAAEAGSGVDREQEACQGLCRPGEVWVSRAGGSPLPWAQLGQGQSTLCQAPRPDAPTVSAVSHPDSRLVGVTPRATAGWTHRGQPTCLTCDRCVVTRSQWDFMVQTAEYCHVLTTQGALMAEEMTLRQCRGCPLL